MVISVPAMMAARFTMFEQDFGQDGGVGGHGQCPSEKGDRLFLSWSRALKSGLREGGYVHHGFVNVCLDVVAAPTNDQSVTHDARSSS